MKPTRSSSAATRKKLLDAAAALFAQHGFRGVSIRQIADTAGVNSALVSYHFGSKDLLFEEVIRASAASHVAERMHQLTRARAEGKTLTLEGLLRMYVEPLLVTENWISPGNQLARLHAFMITERPEQAEEIAVRAFNTVNAAFVDELCRLLPQLSREVVLWRFYAMIGSLLFFHNRPSPPGLMSISGGRCDASDADEVLRQLLPAFVAAMAAPEPKPLAALPDHRRSAPNP